MDSLPFASDVPEDDSWQSGGGAADDEMPLPPPPPPSPINLYEDDVWTIDKENIKFTAFEIELMPIEILTQGSLMEIDPRGVTLSELLGKDLNRTRKKTKRKKTTSSRVIRPLRL